MFFNPYRFLSDELLPANGAFVGLAPPGEVGSWQLESKVSLQIVFLDHITINLFRKLNELMLASILLIYRAINSGQKQMQMVILR